MTRSEVVALKRRHVELTRQRKRARGYLERHGTGGAVDTLYKNEALIQEADAELPIIEAKLKQAWD